MQVLWAAFRFFWELRPATQLETNVGYQPVRCARRDCNCENVLGNCAPQHQGIQKRIVLGQPSMGSVVPNNILLQMGHYRTLPLAIIANYQQICNIRNIYLMIFACCRGLWSPVAAFFINFPWVGAWQLGLCQVIYLQSNHFILDNHVLLFFIPIW